MDYAGPEISNNAEQACSAAVSAYYALPLERLSVSYFCMDGAESIAYQKVIDGQLSDILGANP
eukprot:6201344-Pleurochrysis_carterae.AAC.4